MHAHFAPEKIDKIKKNECLRKIARNWIFALSKRVGEMEKKNQSDYSTNRRHPKQTDKRIEKVWLWIARKPFQSIRHPHSIDSVSQWCFPSFRSSAIAFPTLKLSGNLCKLFYPFCNTFFYLLTSASFFILSVRFCLSIRIVDSDNLFSSLKFFTFDCCPLHSVIVRHK